MILKFFKKLAIRRARNKVKTMQLIKEYEHLIEEYGKIQNKTSELTRSERNLVEARVIHLIQKRHIEITPKNEG